MPIKESETAPGPLLKVPQATQLPHHAECLDQSQAAYLVVGSVSVSFYEPTLFSSVDAFVMSLVPLPATILPPSLYQDSPAQPNFLTVGLCICFHQLLYEVSLMTIGLDTNV